MQPYCSRTMQNRLTRRIFWSGFAASLLLVTVFLTSLRWTSRYVWRAGSSNSGCVELSAGQIRWRPFSRDPGYTWSLFRWSQRPWWGIQTDAIWGSRRYFYLPLWIPLVTTLAITASSFVSWPNRNDRSCVCTLCAYDLTGNVSGRCPECGTPILGEAAQRLHLDVASAGKERDSDFQ